MTEQTRRPRGPTPYAAAGVDIEAGDKAVELMKGLGREDRRPEVIGGLGGFAGLFDASALTALHPAAAGHLDRRRRHQGRDRAGDGHPRHDRLRPGRHGRRRPRRLRRRAAVHDRLHRHPARSCPSGSPRSSRASPRPASTAGCALVGGETAEHPGLLEPDEYDVAGAATGVVEAAQLLGPDRVRPGDVVVAMASSGLHSNGYSLVRHVLPRRRPAGRSTAHVDELGRTLGEELLEPTRIYAQACLGARAPRPSVHAIAHITGGGLAANLARVLPAELSATHRPRHLDAAADLRRRRRVGAVSQDDLERRSTGRRHGRAPARRRRRPSGRDPRPVRRATPGWRARCGSTQVRGGEVRLTGQYAGWSPDRPPDPCFGPFERRFEPNVVHFGRGVREQPPIG